MNRITILVLTAAAILRGSLAFAQAPAPASTATPLTQAERFAAKVAEYEAGDRANPPPVGAILFAGDSQFYRWKTIHEDLPGYTLINRGIDSFQLEHLIQYADRLVLPYQPRLIVLHVAERHAGLLLVDVNARARAIAWMFAALNSVEPPILELVTARIFEGDKPWTAQRLPLVQDRIRSRFEQLSRRLGDADWLDGGFSAGDLLMVSVLLRSRGSGLLDEHPNLAAYVARGEARPAYKRAFDAQLAVARAAGAG